MKTATYIGAGGIGRTVYADDAASLADALARAKAKAEVEIVVHFGLWVCEHVERDARRLLADRSELEILRSVVVAVRDALPLDRD